MRIECDSSTVGCFAWVCLMVFILTVGSVICFSIHEYREERRYAIEHGLTPHRVVTQPTQPVATPEYDTTSNMVINQSNPGLRDNPYVPDTFIR